MAGTIETTENIPLYPVEYRILPNGNEAIKLGNKISPFTGTNPILLEVSKDKGPMRNLKGRDKNGGFSLDKRGDNFYNINMNRPGTFAENLGYNSLKPGYYQFRYDTQNLGLSSGIYWLRLSQQDKDITRKLIILR